VFLIYGYWYSCDKGSSLICGLWCNCDEDNFINGFWFKCDEGSSLIIGLWYNFDEDSSLIRGFWYNFDEDRSLISGFWYNCGEDSSLIYRLLYIYDEDNRRDTYLTARQLVESVFRQKDPVRAHRSLHALTPSFRKYYYRPSPLTNPTSLITRTDFLHTLPLSCV
jgi:hypothetical protein